jgi:tetrahydromethanopterin S-methyltransferase subunit G
MHNPALISFAQELESALVGGHDTREIRRQMNEIEQRERTAAAKAAAEERERRAEAEAQELAEIDAKATALVAEVEARIGAKLAEMALPAPLVVRRFPNGSVTLTEKED